MRQHLGGLAIIILLCLPGASWAAAASSGVFADDWESGIPGPTDTTYGDWDARYLLVGANIMVSAHTAAARRGAYGLRVEDNDPSTAADGEIAYLQVDGLQVNATQYRMRFWTRIQTAQPGTQMVLAFLATPSIWVLETRYEASTDRFGLAGHARNNVPLETNVAAPASVDGSGWYLVEAVVQGLGTPQGTRSLYINGNKVDTQTGIDFTGVTGITHAKLGQPYVDDRSFVGAVDFDDFRVSPFPQASTLTLAPGAPALDTCSPLFVSVVNSEDGMQAALPYSLEAELQVTGVSGTFYSDAACTRPITHVSMGTGATGQGVHFRPTTAGTATFSARHSDFIARPASVTIPGRPQGVACALGGECVSGFCADGICCNSECNAGTCDACSVATGADTDGTCKIVSTAAICHPDSPHHLRARAHPTESPAGESIDVRWQVETGLDEPYPLATALELTPSPLPESCTLIPDDDSLSSSGLATDSTGEARAELHCAEPQSFELCATTPGLQAGCVQVTFTLPADAFTLSVDATHPRTLYVGETVELQTQVSSQFAGTAPALFVEYELQRLQVTQTSLEVVEEGDGLLVAVPSLGAGETHQLRLSSLVGPGEGSVQIRVRLLDEERRELRATEPILLDVSPFRVSFGCSAWSGLSPSADLLLLLWLYGALWAAALRCRARASRSPQAALPPRESES